MKKKCISLLLALTLCLSLLPMGALADGEAAEPAEEAETARTIEPAEAAETEELAETEEPSEPEEPAAEENPAEAEEPAETEEPIELEETAAEEAADAEITASGTYGSESDLKWTLDDSGTLTISGTGTITDCRGGSSSSWDSSRESVISVVIASGVTGIGHYAFAGCDSLQNVTIPDSVTSIEGYAFWGCTSLTAVTIPDSVTEIGAGAFEDCTSLADVKIGGGVTRIRSGAFENCVSLTSVTIPDSVTYVGVGYDYGVFTGCTGLTEIKLAGDNANYSVADGALYNKDKTTLITYPAGKTDADFTIPDSVTYIGNYAFYGCGSLTSVTIPDNVTSIGTCAFADCAGLESVKIGGGVISIYDDAFYGTPWLEKQGDFFIVNGTLWRYQGESADVEIPDNVTSIGLDAFSGCTSLTSVKIPNSVTSIGIAFGGCTGLTSVVIPASVTGIGLGAFGDCTSLTSVTFLGDRPGILGSAGSCVFGNIQATAYYYEDASGWEDIAENSENYGLGEKLTWVSMGKKYLASADGNAAAANADGTPWESGVMLTAAVKADEGLTDAVKTAKGIQKYTVYTVGLEKDGQTAEAGGSYTLTLALPAGYDAAKCAVYQVSSDGALTAVSAVYADGVFSFTANGLGTYVVAVAASQYKPGDVNGDGSVDMKDVLRLMKYVGGQNLTLKVSGDINGDTSVDMKDVLRLMKYVGGQNLTIH